ncbi:family 2 glycosyl transferase [Bacillus methanolicus PB1]|uniref:Family 2 glycosyl transferase n=1 Tax=Bacillus methanolicus PB1 TaxID=997296 RepID=I3E4C9_BACMT|nr:glycosyltransferase [Bacillus methanolicus]EIJ81350.1 family 2 glycosyl transferase [Bacillus methanolicus PB1]
MVQPSGILWVGPVGDIGGYGNASRNLLRALQHIELPLYVLNIGQIDAEIGEEDIDLLLNIMLSRRDLGDHPVLIIHSTPETFVGIKKDGFIKKIGITVFETDRIPLHWASMCNDMDEVWVPSQFNYRTFTESGVDPSKVHVIHYPIDVGQYVQPFDPYPFPSEVKSFKFLYTLAFDFRKGLDLLIPSYCEEFSNAEDVSLIVKIYVPGGISQESVSELVSSYIPDKENNPHIHFILEKTPRKDLLSLYSSSSCYVSTERACGWGMPQIEMMAMGKPVISVNWGGGTEFMNDKNAFLIEPEPELEWVNSELQRARPVHYFRHKWAKVSKQNVMKTMREAFENHKKREEIALQAKLDIANKFSTQMIAEQIKARLFV